MNIPLKPGDFRWPVNGMLADLRTAIAGRANYLAALGLLVYTEVLGRWILQARGVKKPGNEEAFYCFYEEFMEQQRSAGEKIYEHYRHGAAHVYGFLAADVSIVQMNANPDEMPDEALKGIVLADGGRVKRFAVNAYFRDFQRGLAKAAGVYPELFQVDPESG